ncbi:serine hydrolase domain-containing protein [Mesorhizobium sp. M0220]|uniref:serine hydrolase domain-containing protein n=1 Tax=Mesorhizobium sp. M0220 TaxID=2956920 RepID=UPI0033396D56
MRIENGRIGGFVAPGFESLRDCFARNFNDGYELGAAFAVVYDGKLVVDLWGGIADAKTERAWSLDTLQLIFSGTKGLVAAVILMLIDRGLIDLDQPVSRYWPEFDKSDILVRHIVTHGARLPGIESPVAADDITNDLRMSDLLARQLPCSDPRAVHCYHPLTFGWLCGEVIRRISGRSVGTFFAEEIAAPLELELWIGLPEEEEDRVSTLALARNWGISDFLDPMTWAHDPLVQSIWSNPDHFTRDSFPWNRRAWHAAEIPGVNAIGTARAIAKFYGWLAGGGTPLISERVTALARRPLADWVDAVHGGRRRTGIGFELQNDLMPYGPPPGAFGHTGAGGSNHGAWPEQKVGYSYAMNLMHDNASNDRRALRLLTALYQALVKHR